MAWQRHGCIGKCNARCFGAIHYSSFLEREGAFKKSPVETAGLTYGRRVTRSLRGSPLKIADLKGRLQLDSKCWQVTT